MFQHSLGGETLLEARLKTKHKSLQTPGYIWVQALGLTRTQRVYLTRTPLGWPGRPFRQDVLDELEGFEAGWVPQLTALLCTAATVTPSLSLTQGLPRKKSRGGTPGWAGAAGPQSCSAVFNSHLSLSSGPWSLLGMQSWSVAIQCKLKGLTS